MSKVKEQNRKLKCLLRDVYKKSCSRKSAYSQTEDVDFEPRVFPSPFPNGNNKSVSLHNVRAQLSESLKAVRQERLSVSNEVRESLNRVFDEIALFSPPSGAGKDLDQCPSLTMKRKSKQNKSNEITVNKDESDRVATPRPKRAVKLPSSYKEPSLAIKVRKGHKFFNFKTAECL